MTKLKIMALCALMLAIGAGGVVVWHYTRPTVADSLTGQASTVLKALPPTKAAVPGLVSGPTADRQIAILPAEKKRKVSSTYGVIRIPKMNLTFPIVEGTDESRDLSKGIGHYVDTVQAGQVGNFSLAGHVCCAGNGQPFKKLYMLDTGDPVYVDTALGTYTYKVISSTKCGTSQQIVHMSKIEVIYPVPCDAKATPTRRLMTLTTCKVTEAGVPSIMRRIVYTELVAFNPR